MNRNIKPLKIAALLALTLCLIFSLGITTAFAMPGDTVNDADLWRVYDGGDYIEDEAQNELDAKAVEISDRYGIDVVVWVVSSVGDQNYRDYSDDAFDYNNYGYGDDYDGVFLLICMDPDNRGLWISTCGDAEYIYYDQDFDILEGYIIDYLRDRDFVGAINTYLDVTDSFLNDEINGSGHYWTSEEIDLYSSDGGYMSGSDELTEEDKFFYRMIGLGISLIVGLIIAVGGLAIMVGVMRTGVEAAAAQEYLVDGTFNLREQRDKFRYSNVTKSRKESSSGGGGGHGSHRSSSGRSHGGGGRHF
ncbi:MAG: TPM domain-containing protein [Firmicutes bacterium]|nr:TPM domain-containing protein [Bacillota bacterium]